MNSDTMNSNVSSPLIASSGTDQTHRIQSLVHEITEEILSAFRTIHPHWHVDQLNLRRSLQRYALSVIYCQFRYSFESIISND